MVYTAIVLPKSNEGQFIHLFGDHEGILQDQIDAAVKYYDEGADVLRICEPESEFVENFNKQFENIMAFSTPKEAVDWAEEQATAQSVITWLGDAEDECKDFLVGRGYEVFADKESAVEELEFEVLAAKVGKTEINTNVVPDVWEKVTELSAKHGWLHVLSLLKA